MHVSAGQKKSRIRLMHYLSTSFKNISYPGKYRRWPVDAVRVSKVNLPFATSATNGTNDPNHTNASSPTVGSLLTWKK